MIKYRQAKKEIEYYFDYCGFDKTEITKDLIKDFVEMCNSDYENWIKDMLNSYFNPNNELFEKGLAHLKKE